MNARWRGAWHAQWHMSGWRATAACSGSRNPCHIPVAHSEALDIRHSNLLSPHTYQSSTSWCGGQQNIQQQETQKEKYWIYQSLISSFHLLARLPYELLVHNTAVAAYYYMVQHHCWSVRWSVCWSRLCSILN